MHYSTFVIIIIYFISLWCATQEKSLYAICGQRKPCSACTFVQGMLRSESTDAHADLDLRCPQIAWWSFSCEPHQVFIWATQLQSSRSSSYCRFVFFVFCFFFFFCFFFCFCFFFICFCFFFFFFVFFLFFFFLGIIEPILLSWKI